MKTSPTEHHVPTLHDPTHWVDEFGDALFSYAVVKVSHREVAEDLVQETFLAAISARQSFRGECSHLTWLISILRRKIIDYFRQLSRDSKLVEAGSEKAAKVAQEAIFNHRKHWHHPPGRWSTDTQAMLEQEEFWAIFDECLSLLPPNLATAFQLCEAQDEKFEVVCKKLEISPTNLSVRLHRARLSLRRCLEIKWFFDSSGGE